MCQFSDKFYAAVRALAADGSIKTRLAGAYADNLDPISDDEIPDIIRPRFELLRRQMRAAKPIGRESPIVASVRKMSAAEASRCASLIVAMFSELVLVKSTGERLRLRRREPKKRSSRGGGHHPATLN
ncbi:MAG: hypothetical protein ACE5G3_06540 [Gammaproteobacteria bacterium]